MGRPPGPLSRSSGPRLRPRTDLPVPCPDLPKFSLAGFKASVGDPFYEPRDRLLLKRAGRVIAHVHLTHRVMQFGPLQIPVAGLKWLAIAPESRGRGLGSHLLAAAEKQARDDGAVVGLLRTTIPYFFRKTGWALCGQPCSSTAGAHSVLARLLEEGMRHPSRHPHRRLHIRPWRRWEEGALVRIYRQNLPGMYGPPDRTPAYWQWLLRRHAYDEIYVALDGPDLWDLKEARTPIVGYAVLKGHRIIELMTAPGRRKAAAELLAHACGDAIECDYHSVAMCAPPDSLWHDLFVPPGSDHRVLEAEGGEVCMAQDLGPDPPAPAVVRRVLPPRPPCTSG